MSPSFERAPLMFLAPVAESNKVRWPKTAAVTQLRSLNGRIAVSVGAKTHAKWPGHDLKALGLFHS